jgi:DNA-binding FadR family transcriptional regulator
VTRSSRDAAARSKAERVADELEQRIRVHRLTAGDFLGTKAALRTQLKVGPATLDTALGVLADRGLVDVRVGVKGGVRVAELPPALPMSRARAALAGGAGDAAQAGQALALCLALDAHVVARAVAAATADDHAALRAARGKLESSDAQTYVQAHQELHLALLDAGHDAVLAAVVRSLMMVLDATIGGPLLPAADPGTWVPERIRIHLAVVDAVLARDLEGAWRALLDHAAPADSAGSVHPVLPAGVAYLQQVWRAGVLADRGAPAGR